MDEKHYTCPECLWSGDSDDNENSAVAGCFECPECGCDECTASE